MKAVGVEVDDLSGVFGGRRCHAMIEPPRLRQPIRFRVSRTRKLRHSDRVFLHYCLKLLPQVAVRRRLFGSGHSHP